MALDPGYRRQFRCRCFQGAVFEVIVRKLHILTQADLNEIRGPCA